MFSVRVCVRFAIGGFVRVFVRTVCVWTSGGVSVRISAKTSVRVLERACVVSCAVPVRISGVFLSGCYFHMFCRVNVFVKVSIKAAVKVYVSVLLRVLFSKLLSMRTKKCGRLC